MTKEEKIIIIEAAHGGPTRASKAAGVSYSTWHRWKCDDALDSRAERTIDLMLNGKEVQHFRSIVLQSGGCNGKNE